MTFPVASENITSDDRYDRGKYPAVLPRILMEEDLRLSQEEHIL